MITRVRRANAELRKGFASVFFNGIIVKCCQGIVIGRYDYSTVRVRPILSDITVIRLSVLATLLTNRQTALYYNIWADSDNGSTWALQA